MSILSKGVSSIEGFEEAFANCEATGTQDDIDSGAKIQGEYLAAVESILSQLCKNPLQFVMVVLGGIALGGSYDPFSPIRGDANAFVAKWTPVASPA
jgi:predicted ATP-dependent Lon-type protease